MLQSRWVSRSHAILSCQDDVIVLAPVSEKLTLVNGERTEGIELKDGDSIQLGRTKLKLRTVD